MPFIGNDSDKIIKMSKKFVYLSNVYKFEMLAIEGQLPVLIPLLVCDWYIVNVQ